MLTIVSLNVQHLLRRCDNSCVNFKLSHLIVLIRKSVISLHELERDKKYYIFDKVINSIKQLLHVRIYELNISNAGMIL